MDRTSRYALVLAVGSLAFLSRESGAQTRRPITEKDLFSFVWAADPQISPDGSQVLFVRVTVNQDKDRYETSIYIVPADGSAQPRPLTTGHNDASPRWAPNGRDIAFVRTPEPVDGKSKAAQIYLISLGGGEARPLTDLSQGASTPRWSPDGRTIAFLSAPEPDSIAGKDSAGKTADSTQKKRKSDVRVIARAQYRWNGAGYTDVDSHTHIWTVSSSIGTAISKPRQLTFGTFDEGDPRWSPDGSRLYFTSDRHLEPYFETVGSELYTVPSGGGDIQKIAGIDGDIGPFAVSPDGKQIAFVGSENAKPLRMYDQSDLFAVATTPGATARNVTASYDFPIDDGIGADQHPPRAGGGPDVIWSRDGKSVLVRAAEHGNANLKRIGIADGSVSPVTQGDQEVVSYTATADASKFVALIATATNIGDLFVGNSTPTTKLYRLTDVNAALFSTLDIPVPEEIWYTSFDGKKIQGWILKPNNFNPAKKYPLILEIHGGPNTAYGNSFTHEFDWMAAKGYVVLYTNPRGSTSYGQDFANIIQFNYPGDDYKDLMVGVDSLIRRGYVDSTKLGVTGGSGGGVLTNWTITQTNRFAAAVSMRSIADWSNFWYTADFTLFHPTWFRGPPWEVQKDFDEHSAITYITKVKTPLMLVEGEADMRTPPTAGGEVMFRALKYLRVPAAMVRFPGETHELSRSGKPWHRIERLQHILGWFDKYLQNVPTTLYDVR
jgi:dipeptidyl aminopeptidase/acylaminoacyl peptidase